MNLDILDKSVCDMTTNVPIVMIEERDDYYCVIHYGAYNTTTVIENLKILFLN